MNGNEVVNTALGLAERQVGNLRFEPAVAASARGIGGHWSGIWEKPQFLDNAHMTAEIENLDDVVGIRMAEVDEEKGEATYWDGWKGIKSKKTGQHYAIKSDKYTIVQDWQIAKPLVQAANELNLKTVGSFHGIGTGRTTGYILLSGVDPIDLGQVEGHTWHDWMAPGVHFWNSFTGETSFGADIFMLRKACDNLCLIGDLLGKLKSSHLGNQEGIEKEFKALITDIARRVPGLVKAVEKAKQTPIMEVQLPDLLWGLGTALPISAIDEICTAPEKFTPEIVKGSLNAWNVYNAVEAWISYRPAGVTNPKVVDRIAESAAHLLTKDVSKLIEAGKERRDAWILEQTEAENRRIHRQIEKAEAVKQGIMLRGD